MDILFVGLGNPGREYRQTRHNAGRDWVDFWRGKYHAEWRVRKKLLTRFFQHNNFVFAEPLTFMNQSGKAITALLMMFKISPAKLCIVHDELDLPLGQWKLDFARGSPLHKGVISVEKALGTRGFWRLRLGIDNRTPYQRLPGEQYVLQKFLAEEMPQWRELLFQLEPKELARQMKENDSLA